MVHGFNTRLFNDQRLLGFEPSSSQETGGAKEVGLRGLAFRGMASVSPYLG